MSEQRIVNRITSPFQDIEKAKLAESTLDLNYDANGSEVADGLPTAEDLDTVVAEQPEDNIGNIINQPVVQDWSGGPGHVSTAEVVALVLKKQLEFEEKVTAAFKHLGLDVRRFFGV